MSFFVNRKVLFVKCKSLVEESLTRYELRHMQYDILLSAVHFLDHILIAIQNNTLFDLECWSKGVVVNSEFLSDD
jgi:hypothetical protein